MDDKIKSYIKKNEAAWQAAAKRKFWKNVFICLIALFVAILALGVEYGGFMSLAIILSLFVKFVLEPWSIKCLKKTKGYNDELD